MQKKQDQNYATDFFFIFICILIAAMLNLYVTIRQDEKIIQTINTICTQTEKGK